MHIGFVKGKGKGAAEKFKNAPLRTFDEVKDFDSYGGIIGDDEIVIDIDDMKQADILMDIIEDRQMNCIVYQTSKGMHFMFKCSEKLKCKTGVKLACGLTADIKVGGNYHALKVDGVVREVIWDKDENSDYENVPKWLLPVNSKVDFFNMAEGQGRDSALYSYILVLNSHGFTKDESRECIGIINKWILKDSLSSEDIDRITRDEAFPEEVFFDGKKFRHDQFAIFLKNQNHIKRINGELHVYENGVYVSGMRKIESQMIKYIPTMRDSQRKEVLKYMEISCPNDEKSADLNYIAFENGVLNIETGELLPFSPEYVITNKIPWNYEGEAYSEVADRVLDNIACHDNEVRSLLEECIGYCFYRKNIAQRAFILLGDKHNGKSTFIKVLNTILGDDNVAALDLKNLGDRFAKASLFRKLANIGDDISDEFIADPSLFKKITSGDRIQAEFKGQDAFEFNPYVKLIFSANSIPRIKDKTGAVLRRLIIIPFDANFTENDADYDPNIEQKLTQQDSIEYMIRIGVEGLKRLLKNKRFSKSVRSQKSVSEYEEFNNPIIGFFKEHEEGYLYREDTKTIYHAYCVYCNENGLIAESKNQFGRSLKAMYQVESVPKTIKGKTVRMYATVTE